MIINIMAEEGGDLIIRIGGQPSRTGRTEIVATKPRKQRNDVLTRIMAIGKKPPGKETMTVQMEKDGELLEIEKK